MIRSKITALSVLSELWSSAIDRIEYAITSRLAILDKSADRTQRTSLDRAREAENEELQRALPAIDLDRKGPKH